MSLTFFLTDDDADDREVFAEALNEADSAVGYMTIVGAKETLAILNAPDSPKPDLIFLDINLPQVSGWECLKELKTGPNKISTPVVMYSTSSEERDHKIAQELGAVGLLTKPSNFQELVEVLSKLVKVIKEGKINQLSTVLRQISKREI